MKGKGGIIFNYYKMKYIIFNNKREKDNNKSTTLQRAADYISMQR